MKYALIGCGRVAPSHIKAAKENGFEIAAVCDIRGGNIDDMFARSVLTAEETKGIRRYTDYREMVRAERPELVSVIRQAAADGMMELESKMRSLFLEGDSVPAGTFLLKGLDPGVYGDKTDVKMTQSVTFRDPLEDVPDDELADRLTTILGARARWGKAETDGADQ